MATDWLVATYSSSWVLVQTNQNDQRPRELRVQLDNCLIPEGNVFLEIAKPCGTMNYQQTMATTWRIKYHNTYTLSLLTSTFIESEPPAPNHWITVWFKFKSHACGCCKQYLGIRASAWIPFATRYSRKFRIRCVIRVVRLCPLSSRLPDHTNSANAAARGQILLETVMSSVCSVHSTASAPRIWCAWASVRFCVKS